MVHLDIWYPIHTSAENVGKRSELMRVGSRFGQLYPLSPQLPRGKYMLYSSDKLLYLKKDIWGYSILIIFTLTLLGIWVYPPVSPELICKSKYSLHKVECRLHFQMVETNSICWPGRPQRYSCGRIHSWF